LSNNSKKKFNLFLFFALAAYKSKFFCPFIINSQLFWGLNSFSAFYLNRQMQSMALEI